MLYRRLECKTTEIGGGVVIFEMQLGERALIKYVAPAELVALADGAVVRAGGTPAVRGPGAVRGRQPFAGCYCSAGSQPSVGLYSFMAAAASVVLGPRSFS